MALYRAQGLVLRSLGLYRSCMVLQTILLCIIHCTEAAEALHCTVLVSKDAVATRAR